MVMTEFSLVLFHKLYQFLRRTKLPVEVIFLSPAIVFHGIFVASHYVHLHLFGQHWDVGFMIWDLGFGIWGICELEMGIGNAL